MAECFMLGCKEKAVHIIKDATLNKKKFNGKKICVKCHLARKLLKSDLPK